tara:strand:- start:1800 stop:2819 length:1020 start_codon:yes stop_codon:yes gene_type:complete
MNQKIKILLLLNFFLINLAFSKELPTLFEIKISSDQYTNTNDGLNKAFNKLIQKLSGSRSEKFLWRIGDAQLKKIDFVSSYTTEIVDGNEFLSVSFNSDLVIPELRKLDIPLIGFNRPVILFLIKLDTGESVPIYVDGSITSNSFVSEIKQIFTEISQERGVYLELPEFDLEDQNLLRQTNILFSSSDYINEKFYNDAFLSIDLVRIGINQWTLNGDLINSSPIQETEVIDYLYNNIQNFLDNFLLVQQLEPGVSGEKLLITITGLGNFEDFQSVESELDKIFAIQTRTFYSFERTKIDYTAQLFQTKESLLKELRGSTNFLIKKYTAELDHLELEYLN